MRAARLLRCPTDDAALNASNASEQDVAPGWSFNMWLQRLSIHDIVDTILLDKSDPSTNALSSKGELARMAALKKLSVEELEVLLEDGGCVRRVAEAMFNGVKKFGTGSGEVAMNNEKFVSNNMVHYGQLSTYYNGLEGLIGPPSVALNEAIEREHCSAADSYAPFSTPNYGVKTCSCIELFFVVEGEPGVRTIINKHRQAVQLLHEGPNGTKQYPQETVGRVGRREAVSLADMEGKLLDNNKELLSYGHEPLGREELLAARLYTGPMYLKYNVVLRGQNKSAEASYKQFTDLCKSNRYTTTLHAINSAIVKLSKLMTVQKVYRGIGGKYLPAQMYTRDHHGVRGGIEFAFMSTSTRREVALGYLENASESLESRLLFEVQMGMVDRGADLSWLSQYPDEKEILFAALTGIDVQGYYVDGDVTVLEVRLSINDKNLTIEEVGAKMQRSHLELIDLLIDDLKNAGAPPIALDRMQSLRIEQQRREPSWFNRATNFREATNDALVRQQRVLKELGDPSTWGLLDGKFDVKCNREERKKLMTDMRSVALLAARVGEEGFAPAIEMLKLGLDAELLGDEPTKAPERPELLATKKTSSNLHESIKLIMDPSINGAIQRAGVSVRPEDYWRLRVAYYLLSQGLELPWPRVLVKVLEDGSPETREAVLELLKLKELCRAELTESPLKENAPVIWFDDKVQRWEQARVHEIKWLDADEQRDDSVTKESSSTMTLPTNLSKLSLLIRGSDIVEVEPGKSDKVLSMCTTGVGMLFLAASRQGASELVEKLLDAGVSTRYCDRNASTALVMAAKQKRSNMCRLLRERGLNIHLFNNFRQNAFDLAVMHRNSLLLRAVKPSKADEELAQASQPALEAAKRGDLDWFVHSGLDSRYGKDGKNGSGPTPLMLAVFVGGYDLVRAMIGARADVLSMSSSSASALTVAAENGDTQIFKCLIDALDSSKLKDMINDDKYDNGRTLLMCAAQYGHADTVQCLLDHGACATKFREQLNAVFLAAQYGHATVVHRLLDVLGRQQQDIDFMDAPENKSKHSPLMLAIRYGHADVAKLLLERRANPSASDSSGWHCLHRAAGAGRNDIVEMLLEKNADVHQKYKVSKFQTALHAAAQAGHPMTVSLLLSKGAEIDSKTESGDTALHAACRCGHDLVARQLIPGKASIELCDNNGRSPLMTAASTGNEGLVRYLVQTIQRDGKLSGLIAQRDEKGDNALMLARRSGHSTVAIILQQCLCRYSASTESTETDPVELFSSNQQTLIAQLQTNSWIANQRVKSWRLSYPPFNAPSTGVQENQAWSKYQIPVFGRRIPMAVMKLFELEGIRELASKLNVEIPTYSISSFVQKKAIKVHDLIKVAKSRDDCQTGANAQAVLKLEKFINDFVKLQPSDIKNAEAWEQFVADRSCAECLDRLHFDSILSNFGFSDATSTELRSHTIEVEGDGHATRVSLEQHSLRWLSKSLAGYNVVGCLTDVVNLAFAMGNPPQGNLSEQDVVSGIEAIVRKLGDKNFDGLWLPTHLIHDAETDDQLAWLLLKYIYQKREPGSSMPRVLVQLPVPNADFPELEILNNRFKEHGCETFRDPTSRNAQAIIDTIRK